MLPRPRLGSYGRTVSKPHDDTAQAAVSSAPLTDSPDIPEHDTGSASHAGSANAVPDVSVVIVNYNVRDFLEQALRSVRRASARLDVEVFVADNNSVDGSVPMVRERFPEVHLLANEDNVGFGVANNMAIRRARGRYVLILNPDTIVQEDTLEHFVSFMDGHPNAGAAGCQILNPDGTFAPESRRSFPTPQVAFYRMTGLARFFPKSPTFGRYNMTFLPRDEVAEVDALSGSCMFVRREALLGNPEAGSTGIGLFDEDFFMYGEDLDLCYRIQEAGWKIYYTPGTQIIHYKGESTKKGEFRYVKLFYGAMVLFTRKHLQNRHSRVFAGILQAAILARAGFSVASRAASRLLPAATDFALVYLAVVALAWLRSSQLGAPLSPLYFTAVAPAYGLGTLSGILLSGGYALPDRGRIRPVLIGIVIGFLTVSAVSFFAKEIAFSRAVVL
ncbi:MAG: glycosyltransferase, partial [Rhodothermales bacterium]|nr:glycosyltransferase [Rhodothermales bacterium]